MSSLVSPSDFVTAVSSLDYHERIKKAHEFGRDHAKDAELTGWIQELRKHPDPAVPAIPEEKGFTDILPPQKLNIAKYYDQDQYAIAAAIASNTHSDLLVAELSSPSKWFQTKAAKAVARQVKSDEVLEKQVLNSTKAVRKKLLHALVREKKVALLEKLYPSLFTQKGPEFAIDILHGCSSPFIKARFAEDPLLILNPHLDWKKLGQYHGKLLLEMLEDELKATHFLKRFPVWTTWSGRFFDAFFFKAHLGAALWDLWVKYPAWYHRHLQEHDWINLAEKDMKIHDYGLHSPDCITSRARHYLTVTPAEVFKFFKTLAGPDTSRETFVQNAPMTAFFNGPQTPSFINEICELYRYWFSLDNRLFIRGYMYINEASTFLTYCNPQQAVQFAKTGFEIYGKIAFTERDNKYYLYNFVRCLFNHLGTIYAKIKSRLTRAINFTGDEAEAKKQQTRRAYYNEGHAELVTLTLTNVVSYWPKTDLGTSVQDFLNNIIPDWNKFPVTSVGPLLDGLQPFIEMRETALAKRNDSWVYTWDVQFTLIGQKLFGVVCEAHPGRTAPEGFYTEKEFKIAEEAEKRLIETFYSYWATDPIKQNEALTSVYHAVDQATADDLYKCYKDDLVCHILRTTQDNILKTTWPLITHSVYQEHLKAAFAHKLTSDALKEDLQGFRDVTDHAVRKELEKATDSNSEPQRKAAMKNLIDATHRTRDAVQLKRTLTFLRNKLKNEQITMRIAGIAALLDSNKGHIDTPNRQNWTSRLDRYPQLHFPEGVTQEILDLYFALLQDALEIRDLDLTPKNDEGEGGGQKLEGYQLAPSSHPLLKYFQSLSEDALWVGASDPTGPVFRFGVELQWRLQSFRAGPKNIMKTFSITLPDRFNYLHAGGASSKFFERKHKDGVFAAVVGEMEARVGAKNKEWRESYYWTSLFWLVNNDWHQCPSVVDLIKSLFAAAKQKRDSTGLCLIEGNSALCRIFEFILALQKKEAYKIPLVQEYFELMLTSYQAKSVVFQWLVSKEHGLKGKAQKQQRDKSVKELLALTKSAIHLKFVWRHLLSWAQSSITPFLNAQDPFRGVFYEEPAQRKIREPKKEVAAKPTPGRRRKVAKPVDPPPKLKDITSSVPKDARTGVKDIVKRATKAERKMQKDLSETKRDDHEDYWVLPACYGLHKLLPSQADLLAKKWASIANNSDRDIPFRTVACRRFTLVPTVNYADIVFYVEANPKFAVNLLEALMQGTIYNDEPLAPLNYLLSPQFLSSDRARVAAYAVCAAVKYLKSVGITDIISLVLSGKRREGLKVTAYKEMIRLLASIPTSKHISMIQTEWKRKEMHRDVRIAIVKAAYLFLYKNTEKGIKVAWEILLDAVSLKRQEEWKYSHELIIALLGASPILPRDSHGMSESLFLKPLLFEFFQSTTKCKIPADHCERFANEIVMPLCKTALVDDVKTIALFSLVMYKTLGKIADTASALLYELMADEKNNLLSSAKPSDQGVFDARWRHAGLHLLKMSATNGPWVPAGVEEKKKADRSYVTRILRRTVDRINGYAIDERRKRIHMVDNLRHFIALLPANGPYSLWDWEQEKQFLKPLREINFLWEWLAERRNTQLADRWANPTEYFVDNVKTHLHSMFFYASTRPDVGAKVVSLVGTLMGSRASVYSGYKETDKHWTAIILALFEEDGVWEGKGGQPNDGYDAIRLRATLNALKFRSQFFVHAHLQKMLAFFDSCIDAAAKGLIPDLTKNLGTLFTEIIQMHVDASCAKPWNQSRVLCKKCKTLVNHVTHLLTPPANGNIIPLVIAVDYSTKLLESHPGLLAQATDRVGAVLHWLLHEQTGTAKSDLLQSKFVSLLNAIEKNSRPNLGYGHHGARAPITPVLAIITALLDQHLDLLPPLEDDPAGPSELIGDREPAQKGTNKPKSGAYARLSTEIGLHVLNAYPQFVLWRPQCFWRFVDSIALADIKEPVSSPLRLKSVSDIVCLGYYQQLSTSSSEKSTDDAVYAKGLAAARRLLASAEKSPHPVFYRSIACHLSIFLGYLSTRRDATDLTYTWRPEFMEILDTWCGDSDGSIKKLAWEVDTTTPVTSTPYSSLTKRVTTPSGW